MEKLKELIDAKYRTRAEFAAAIGIDPSTLSRLLVNGNWRADRIEKAVKALRIPAKDIPAYFFPSKVALKAPKEPA